MIFKIKMTPEDISDEVEYENYTGTNTFLQELFYYGEDAIPYKYIDESGNVCGWVITSNRLNKR